MLKSAGRVLEISVAANTDTWMVEDRHRLIDEMPMSPRRLFSRAALGFAVACPSSAGMVLDKIADRQGFNYLGAGVEYSVYLDQSSGEAVKVHRDSANVSHEVRRSLIDEKQADHDALSRSLGSVMLPQEVVVADHPLGDYETLQVRQPFVTFMQDASPFAVNAEKVDPGRLEKLLRSNPGLDAGLSDFIDRSRNMFRRDELLPDTNGANNVVSQPTGSVVLLDSTPIRPDLPQLQGLIMNQLTSLETELRTFA